MAKDNGSLLIWAHPHWTGNDHNDPLVDICHGLEIYNHVSHCENGSGYALSHWDFQLQKRPNLFGFSVDDSHFIPGEPYWNGGWVMVNSASPAPDDLLKALKKGNFYSSQGPEFKKIECDNNMIRIETSPCMYARLIGPRRVGSSINGLEKGPFTEAVFETPSHWESARLEIEDAKGKLAWSNTVFIR